MKIEIPVTVSPLQKKYIPRINTGHSNIGT
jgi:hypothetical protein